MTAVCHMTDSKLASRYFSGTDTFIHRKNAVLFTLNKKEKVMKQSLLEKLNLAYRFKFNDNGHTITANASSLTGKEEVLVDGASVSKKRNLGLSSCHKFHVDGTDYELHFNVTGFLFCRVECRLIVNGETVSTETRSAFDNKKAFVRNLVIFFFVGLIFGYLAATAALTFLG